MKSVLLKAVVATSLVASFVCADGAFVGFEAGYDKSSLKDKWNDNDPAYSYSNKYKDGQFGLGVKGGYDFGMFRAYGEYFYKFKAKDDIVDEDDDTVELSWKSHNFLVGGDFTPSLTDNFKFALGVYTGVSRINLKAQNPATNESVKQNDTGWIIGGKIGGIYELNQNNEIEFGFKTDYTRYKKHTEEEGNARFTATNTGFYLGYNYKF